MNKYIYMSFVAALAFAGCTEEENVMSNNARIPMRFDISASDVFTRSESNLTLENIIRSGLHFSCQYDENGTTIRKSCSLSYNYENNRFESSDPTTAPLYWPSDSRTKVKFAVVAGEGTNGFSDDLENLFGDVEITYAHNPDKDYVAAYVEKSMNQTNNGVVEVGLEHIKGLVSVRLFCDTDNPGYIYSIYDVQLEGNRRKIYNVETKEWAEEPVSDGVASGIITSWFEALPTQAARMVITEESTGLLLGEDNEEIKLQVPPGTYTLSVDYASSLANGDSQMGPRVRTSSVDVSRGKQNILNVVLSPLPPIN